MANHAPAMGDLRNVIKADPKIQRFLNSGNRQLIVGMCPICQLQNVEWKEMKAHVEKCRREHQHPLLMRTCYCPYCLKKLSDGYSLSSHIQSTHTGNLQSITEFILTNSGDVVPISDEKANSKRARPFQGYPTQMLPEPFPFACSACEHCWPTARGLVNHFITMERQTGGKGCGGRLVVSIKPGSRRMSVMNDEIACNRYDFANPITCPFCIGAFDEAYKLSEHVTACHGKSQAKMEEKITPLLVTAPIKKYYFAPFSCSKCRSAFKTIEEWAGHIHERTLNGHPCNGELRVMKKIVKEDGVGAFLANVRPEFFAIGKDGVTLPPQPTPEQQPGTATGTKEVKEEPIDPDDQQNGSHNETIPDDPMTAATTAAAAAAGHAVVKDEPLDEDDWTAANGAAMEGPSTSSQPRDGDEANAASQPPDEHQTSNEPSSNQLPEEEEEDEAYECDDCQCVFPNKEIYIEHMSIEHGMELAPEGLDEEQLARLEAGEDIDIGQPAAKKPKVEEEQPGPSSRYPPLIAPSNPADSWFRCPHCPETCETMTEFKEHTLKCHSESGASQPAMSTCTVCRKRTFLHNEERKQHERECIVFKLSEARDRSFNESVNCYYCKKRIANVYILLHHFMDEHFDTMEKLRKNYLMASEFLPFRCSACKIGFEDPRTLINHFRMREEFGIPCTGNLVVHTYQQSLQVAEDQELNRIIDRIPKLSLKDNQENDPYAECPRDPRPSSDIDLTGKVQCPHCTEEWPRTQLKLHCKMEHPRIYYDYAKYHCRRCEKAVGYFCEWRYAEHYENCTAHEPVGKMGDYDIRELVCAPRSDLPLPPASHRYRLPGLPEGMGNELRPCRFCKVKFTPEGLLTHQKNSHPIHHFTDAPYQCQRCEEVGFYSHEKYKEHLNVCTGRAPVDAEKDLFAITIREIEERTGAERMETPSFRVLIDVDRRKYGHLAAYNRPIKCTFCEAWCSSLPTLVEHHFDSHPSREQLTFLCCGCAKVCYSTGELREHLEQEWEKGNSRCYDQASLNGSGTSVFNTPTQSWDVNRWMRTERPPPMIPARAGMAPRYASLPSGSNWRPAPSIDRVTQEQRYRNLARQEAMERRNQWAYQGARRPAPAPLLPIRPLSLMSKSPLSGERDLFRRQQAAHAAFTKPRGRSLEVAQAQAVQLARFKQQEMKYRMKQEESSSVDDHSDIARVDFSSPLSLPSRMISSDGRRVGPINTPIPPRPSILYQPLGGARIHPTPYNLKAPPRLTEPGTPTMHLSMPVGRAVSSFRPSIHPSILAKSSSRAPVATSGQAFRIIRPMGPANNPPIRRVVIPGPPTLEPAIPPKTAQKVPKKEPKQEPDC